MSTELTKVLCIGVDITWWGGSRGNRRSQFETIVSVVLGKAGSFDVEPVALSGSPNPDAHSATEPNFDADGEVLCRRIVKTIERHPEVEHVILCVDTMLECCRRVGQPARRKSASRGQPTGSVQRDAERELGDYMRRTEMDFAAPWRRDLHIQAGSPIPPRIARIVQRLGESRRPALSPYRASGSAEPRGIVEVFPSEAIWALGVLGFYGDMDSSTVREYKATHPRRLRVDYARSMARRPLEGFVPLLLSKGVSAETIGAWIDEIVERSIQWSLAGPGEVRRSKRFDDPIDSGIAFLTSVACALGLWHQWGDGTDGTIVGPGKLPPLSVNAPVSPAPNA